MELFKYLIGGPTIIILIGGIVTGVFGFLASRSGEQKTPKGIALGAFLGGLIVLIGGIYSGYEQHLRDQLFQRKTEEIATLSRTNAKLSMKIADLRERTWKQINESKTLLSEAIVIAMSLMLFQ